MTALGLFEMDGGVTADSYFDLSSPLFDRISISLNEDYYPGKEFVIEARNMSDKNRYIKSATLNGKTLSAPRLPFSAIKNGGTLVYEMTSDPTEAAWRE